jgi:hypothetical protein
VPCVHEQTLFQAKDAPQAGLIKPLPFKTHRHILSLTGDAFLLFEMYVLEELIEVTGAGFE